MERLQLDELPGVEGFDTPLGRQCHNTGCHVSQAFLELLGLTFAPVMSHRAEALSQRLARITRLSGIVCLFVSWFVRLSVAVMHQCKQLYVGLFSSFLDRQKLPA